MIQKHSEQNQAPTSFNLTLQDSIPLSLSDG